jgi:hypothetical protein
MQVKRNSVAGNSSSNVKAIFTTFNQDVKDDTKFRIANKALCTGILILSTSIMIT